jgi:deoxyhypusine synthase
MDRLGFGLDAVSLHVTGTTRLGTIIMDADLFKDIKDFVDDQLQSRKSQRSTDG